MGKEYYTFVSASNAFGIIRWIAAILLVAISIVFLIRQIRTKKSLAFIASFISALILVPLLIITPIRITINPGETPGPQPVDPIPQVNPEPEPVPEPDVNPVEPVAPSNTAPSTKPSNNQTPSAPSKPDTPDTPDTPDEPKASATYTVIHRQQNLNDDDYSTIESETGTGTAGKEVTPATKTYTGFIAPTTVTVTVAEDNSTEVVYDYNREIIDLAVDDSDLYTASLLNDGYKYGTEVTLTAKDRTGYVFNGWSNGATTNTVTVTLGADEIPEPTYEANAYRIVFNKNSNEATGSMTAQVLTYDQQEQINTNSFTLPGYSFDHWNTKDDDSGDSFTDGQSVKNLAAEGDVDFYAFWTPNANTPYTVKHYKMNIGGSGYAVAETEPKTGTTDTEVTPEHKEYTGFTPDSAQTKKITGDGEMLIEYYYSRNQYTITFGENATSITSDDFVSGQSYYYEQTGTITAGNKTGYTFESWTDGSMDISRSFTMGAENATIGANYRANTYSVIFHANYPNSSSTTSQSFTYDQAATALNANSFDRVGYDFSHWDTKADDSGSEYTDGAEVQNLTDVDGGEYHLYAQWTARNDTRYTVYKDLMNLNGEGYVLDRQGTVYTGTSDSEITVTPTDINGFDLPASQTITIAADGSTEVRFQYVRQKRKLTLRDEEYIETETPSDDYYYGTYITLVAKERDGYTFVNWNGNSSSTNPTVQFNLHYNETYRPIYQANTYNIVFDKNATDATGSMTPQQMTYDQAADLSANQFERNNFIFKGWSTNPNATTKEYSDGDSVINLATSGNVTLYAVWEDKFPVVFSIEGDCIFNGKTGTITTTSACQFDGTDFVGQTFIDTGISLNTEENFDKDYEISFNIDNYSPNGQEPQTTFVSNKISTSHNGAFIIDPDTGQRKKGASSPGVVVRMSGENIDTRSALYNSDETGYDEVGYAKNYTEIQSVKLVRHNRVIYASVNGGNLFELQDVSSYHQYFNQTTWFGAYPDDGSDNPAPKRVLIGTLSNLSIRLGETDWNYYEVKFDPKNGILDASYKKMYVEKGSAIDPLPTTTRSKYVFTGWHIGSTKIEGSYTPSEDVEFKANWLRDVTNSVVTTASLDLIKGEEANLTFSSLGTAEPFTLSSSDESIATVDQNGKVTAIAKGQANIILAGNLSGKTKAVPVTVSLPKYTIHFDSKGGNEIADITDVEEGSTIALPTQPTRTGFVFDGWFLENTDTEFTANTPVMGDTNVEAHWTMDITNAIVSNISITRGESAQINVTNANELEPFTYRSDDTNIVTVDESGNITTVAAGTTTITLVGSRSTLEAALSVSVALPKYTVRFNTHGGSEVADITGITEGDSISTLPSSSLEHYVLDGWFTEENGGEELTNSTPIMGETTYHAHWKKDITQAILSSDSFTLMAGTSEVFSIANSDELEPYSVATGNNTIAVADNDAIRALSEGETTLIITGEKSGLTKTATITVTPSEFTIQFDAGDGTASQNSIAVDAGGTISELPTAELSGYAFDGWWTAAEGGTQLTTETIINEEKMYYAHWLIIMCKLVPKEELHTETCNNSGGCAATSPAKIHSIGDIITYGTAASSTTPKGGDAYDCAIAKDSNNNITTKRFYYLTNNEENAVLMYSETMGKGFNYNQVESKLPTAADWNLLTVQFANGKPTRLPTKSEIQAACQTASETFGSLNSCEYLMEGTKYAVGGDVLPTGLILNVESDNSYWRIMSNNRAVNSTTSASGNGIVPVIEVPLKQLEKYTEKIVQFNIQSEAAQEYFANVDTWSANNDKDTFLKAMKANFDDANRSGDGSRRCIYSGSPDITTSTSIFPNTYRYEENGGTVYCDRPAAYDTGVGGNIKVYLSNENREKGAEATYLKTDNGLIENMIPGTIYRWESEADSNVYGYVKATGERRFITLSSARNVRDLGGLTGAYGTLKYGRLMRGEKLDGNDVSDLRKLGITMEYELRENVQSPRMGTHASAIDDADVYKQRMTIHYDINPADARGSGYYDITRSVLAEFMQDVIDGKNIYFHCSHGADRTGTIAYLAEGLLGIDYETRSRDYELTSLSGRADRTRYYEKKSESDASDPSSNKYSGIKKYVYMTGFLETEQDIINWFKAKLTTQEERDAADQLIEDFRAAMIEGYGQ